MEDFKILNSYVETHTSIIPLIQYYPPTEDSEQGQKDCFIG